MNNTVCWSCFKEPTILVREFLRYVNKEVARLDSIRHKINDDLYLDKRDVSKITIFKKNFYKHFLKVNNEKVFNYIDDYIDEISFSEFQRLDDEDASVVFVAIVRANLEQELRNRTLLSNFIEINLKNVDSRALKVIVGDIDNFFTKADKKCYPKEEYLFWLRIKDMIIGTLTNYTEKKNVKP